MERDKEIINTARIVQSEKFGNGKIIISHPADISQIDQQTVKRKIEVVSSHYITHDENS